MKSATIDTLEALEQANARLERLTDRKSLWETGAALDRLIVESDTVDAGKKSIADLVDFLRVGFLPTIKVVADELMAQTPEGAGCIALTMDITRDDRFERQFIAQLEETADAAAGYPGRIFPFVAVNPNRPNHYALMQRAFTELGYVGVKLYPSLGYAIDSAAMHRVYKYCQAHAVPLLMHCSPNGFYYAAQYIENSSPDHWKTILDQYDDLNICFGHFGGGGALAARGLPDPDSWTGKIIRLMEDHPGVYADISYHDAPMIGGLAERHYFNNLKALLQTETVKERILFGTDYFMIRARLQDKNYWSYFEAHLGDDFTMVAEVNPQRYLSR